MKMILETERLILREFDLDDAPEFFRMVSDPDITLYTGDGCESLEDARLGMQERPLRDYQTHGYGRWAVVLKETGQVIGFAGLKYLEDQGEVDLGYRLFPEYWGRGLATEAAQAALKYGFDTLKIPRVIGIAATENKASIRVLEKLGFRFEKFSTYFEIPIVCYALEKEWVLIKD